MVQLLREVQHVFKTHTLCFVQSPADSTKQIHADINKKGFIKGGFTFKLSKTVSDIFICSPEAKIRI